MMTKLKTILIAAGAALALTAGSASAADWHGHDSHDRGAHHEIANHEFNGGHDFNRGGVFNRGHGPVVHRNVIARERVVDVFRARHVRYVGQPYLQGGYYVARCYDSFGRLEYCRVDPYTGAFVGFTVRL
jgi:hypothetical protein